MHANCGNDGNLKEYISLCPFTQASTFCQGDIIHLI